MNETVITGNGLARLSAELDQLTSAGRQQIAERLAHAARSEANHAESADYLAVREDQALLERRIALLEGRLRSARLIEPDAENGRVDVGEHVRLRDLDSGERLEVELVGQLEGDPVDGRITVASPLGKAILGLRRGEVADVDAPRGRFRFEVVAIRTPIAATAG
ncbi:MAG TPA: transcription elongation factor GreA [Gaiellaceae bacterium]|jgi:transcription elongation factor GreA